MKFLKTDLNALKCVLKTLYRYHIFLKIVEISEFPEFRPKIPEIFEIPGIWPKNLDVKSPKSGLKSKPELKVMKFMKTDLNALKSGLKTLYHIFLKILEISEFPESYSKIPEIFEIPVSGLKTLT